MFVLLEDVVAFPKGRRGKKPWNGLRILRHLMDKDDWATTRELQDQIYWNDENGGSHDPKCVTIAIFRLRPFLKPGYKIVSERGSNSRGYRFVATVPAFLGLVAETLAA